MPSKALYLDVRLSSPSFSIVAPQVNLPGRHYVEAFVKSISLPVTARLTPICAGVQASTLWPLSSESLEA